MVSDEKSGQAPSLPDETAAASPRGERGWFGLVIRGAFLFSAAVLVELVLAAWWRYVDEAGE